MDWNILVTAHHKESWRATQQLKGLVKLHRTPFRDVLIGKVDDVKSFLEAVAKLSEPAPDKPPFVPAFSRIIPVKYTFEFEPEEIIPKLKELVKNFVSELSCKFDVRVERRGLKGIINSQQITDVLREEIQKLNPNAQLDYKNPEKIVVVETIGKIAGIGLLDQSLLSYPFVRV